ncbi:hypothetical protein [Prosthecobacter algae]
MSQGYGVMTTLVNPDPYPAIFRVGLFILPEEDPFGFEQKK